MRALVASWVNGVVTSALSKAAAAPVDNTKIQYHFISFNEVVTNQATH